MSGQLPAYSPNKDFQTPSILPSYGGEEDISTSLSPEPTKDRNITGKIEFAGGLCCPAESTS